MPSLHCQARKRSRAPQTVCPEYSLHLVSSLVVVPSAAIRTADLMLVCASNTSRAALTSDLFCFAALISRQFIDMSRVRIEGLLAAFPKLVGSGKQHTYIETENVRYVYQPLEVSVLRMLPQCQAAHCTAGTGLEVRVCDEGTALRRRCTCC